MLYQVLGDATKLPLFWEQVTFPFALSLMHNLRSADAAERKNVAKFLAAYVQRAPCDGPRIVGHLLLMIGEMSQAMATPGLATMLELLRGLAWRDPLAVTITHVLPLLGNPGLAFFQDALLPWLYELAEADRGFRERLLRHAIRGFPLTNRKSAMTFLGILGQVAVAVPPGLVRRLLGIVGTCIARDDAETSAGALGVFKSSKVQKVVEGSSAEDASPLLTALFEGCLEGGRAQAASWEALRLVIRRRRALVREFTLAFVDRADDPRERWGPILELAPGEEVVAPRLTPTRAVRGNAIARRQGLEFILAQCS
jgi:hypothetical protein